MKLNSRPGANMDLAIRSGPGLGSLDHPECAGIYLGTAKRESLFLITSPF